MIRCRTYFRDANLTLNIIQFVRQFVCYDTLDFNSALLVYYQDRGAVCRSLNPDCSGGFQVRYLARTDARMNTEN